MAAQNIFSFLSDRFLHLYQSCCPCELGREGGREGEMEGEGEGEGGIEGRGEREREREKEREREREREIGCQGVHGGNICQIPDL